MVPWDWNQDGLPPLGFWLLEICFQYPQETRGFRKDGWLGLRSVLVGGDFSRSHLLENKQTSRTGRLYACVGMGSRGPGQGV